ncbi:MAG: hypothetical protein ABIN66_07030 [candidate division WOR-3 bacterium]
MMGLLIAIFVFDGPDAQWVPLDTLIARANAYQEKASVGAVFGRARTGEWQFIGPLPLTEEYWSDGTVSGRTSFILSHPTDPNIAYIAAAGGGVWKTTDGGETWEVLTDALPSLASGALAFEPGNTNVIYYGMGEMHFSGDSKNGDGLYRSEDGGLTWTKIASVADAGDYISRVLVNPVNTNIIMVARNGGIARSTDRGATWTRVLSLSWVSDLAQAPDSPNMYFAGVNDYGVYVSRDTGLTWTALSGGLPGPSEPFYRVQLAISQSDPDIIYAVFTRSSNGGLYGLYKTTDRGSSWTKLENTPDYLYPQGWYDNCIIVDPSDPNIVYAGGVFPYGSNYHGIVRTTDGGLSWEDITDQGSGGCVHPDIHHFSFDADGNLWVACDGGVWMTKDRGETWINRNQGLGTIQFYTLAIHPRDTSVLQGGTQDNGSPRREGSDVWRVILSGDGGPQLFNPGAVPGLDTSYATYQGFGGPYRFVNGHYNRDVSGPWNGVDRASWASGPFFAHPTDMGTIFAGTYRMWRSTNAGVSWTDVSGDLTRGSGVLISGEVNLGSTNIIYVGSSDGKVHLSTDGGSTWLDRSPGPVQAIESIKSNPYAPREAYICTSSRLYHTSDTGKTWEQVCTFNFLVRAMTVDYDLWPPMIMVAGEGGRVIYSPDRGASWEALGTGMCGAEIYDMDFDFQHKALFVATHGRGMWKLPDYQMAVSEPGPQVSRLGLFWAPGAGILYNLPEGKHQISLYDASGRLIARAEIGGERGIWRIPDVGPGVYFARTGSWSAVFPVAK